MLWDRVSLFVKSTRAPGLNVSSLGLTTPLDEIAICGPDGGGSGPDGGVDPPHELTRTHNNGIAERMPISAQDTTEPRTPSAERRSY
jgi:hypothetical protein